MVDGDLHTYDSLGVGDPVLRETHDAGKICPCVGNHNPNPVHVVRHHIWPLGDGGPNTEDNIQWMCSTGHENVHVLYRAHKNFEGAVPWEIRKRFSPFIRKLAERGYKSFQAGELQ